MNISCRERDEIYAINNILKQAEKIKYNDFMVNHLKPCDHNNICEDSDSDNSCFGNGKQERQKCTSARNIGRNSIGIEVTNSAKFPRSKTTDISRKQRVHSSKISSGTFGAV